MGKPTQEYIEADQGSRFHLNAVVTEQKEDLQGFLLDEKKIAEVIKSRDDLSAIGIDGISYRVIKETEVKSVKALIRGIIKNG
jgi:hypothetical protein